MAVGLLTCLTSRAHDCPMPSWANRPLCFCGSFKVDLIFDLLYLMFACTYIYIYMHI